MITELLLIGALLLVLWLHAADKQLMKENGKRPSVRPGKRTGIKTVQKKPKVQSIDEGEEKDEQEEVEEEPQQTKKNLQELQTNQQTTSAAAASASIHQQTPSPTAAEPMESEYLFNKEIVIFNDGQRWEKEIAYGTGDGLPLAGIRANRRPKSSPVKNMPVPKFTGSGNPMSEVLLTAEERRRYEAAVQERKERRVRRQAIAREKEEHRRARQERHQRRREAHKERGQDSSCGMDPVQEQTVVTTVNSIQTIYPNGLLGYYDPTILIEGDTVVTEIMPIKTEIGVKKVGINEGKVDNNVGLVKFDTIDEQLKYAKEQLKSTGGKFESTNMTEKAGGIGSVLLLNDSVPVGEKSKTAADESTIKKQPQLLLVNENRQGGIEEASGGCKFVESAESAGNTLKVGKDGEIRRMVVDRFSSKNFGKEVVVNPIESDTVVEMLGDEPVAGKIPLHSPKNHPQPSQSDKNMDEGTVDESSAAVKIPLNSICSTNLSSADQQQQQKFTTNTEKMLMKPKRSEEILTAIEEAEKGTEFSTAVDVPSANNPTSDEVLFETQTDFNDAEVVSSLDATRNNSSNEAISDESDSVKPLDIGYSMGGESFSPVAIHSENGDKSRKQQSLVVGNSNVGYGGRIIGGEIESRNQFETGGFAAGAAGPLYYGYNIGEKESHRDTTTIGSSGTNTIADVGVDVESLEQIDESNGGETTLLLRKFEPQSVSKFTGSNIDVDESAQKRETFVKSTGKIELAPKTLGKGVVFSGDKGFVSKDSSKKNTIPSGLLSEEDERKIGTKQGESPRKNHQSILSSSNRQKSPAASSNQQHRVLQMASDTANNGSNEQLYLQQALAAALSSDDSSVGNNEMKGAEESILPGPGPPKYSSKNNNPSSDGPNNSGECSESGSESSESGDAESCSDVSSTTTLVPINTIIHTVGDRTDGAAEEIHLIKPKVIQHGTPSMGTYKIQDALKMAESEITLSTNQSAIVIQSELPIID